MTSGRAILIAKASARHFDFFYRQTAFYYELDFDVRLIQVKATVAIAMLNKVDWSICFFSNAYVTR